MPETFSKYHAAAAGPKRVAMFDFLVIGASAGGIACVNRAAELGMRVAIVGTGDKESVSVMRLYPRTDNVCCSAQTGH